MSRIGPGISWWGSGPYCRAWSGAGCGRMRMGGYVGREEICVSKDIYSLLFYSPLPSVVCRLSALCAAGCPFVYSISPCSLSPSFPPSLPLSLLTSSVILIRNSSSGLRPFSLDVSLVMCPQILLYLKGKGRRERGRV